MLIVLIIITILFSFSLYERLPEIGNLMAGNVTLSFETSTFLYNYLEFGVFNINARMLKSPITIESPNVDHLYLSYPPGFLIIPYLLAKIINNNGTLVFVQGYNLLNHYLLSVFISLSVLLMYKKTEETKLILGCIMAVGADAVSIFITGLYYYMMFEYFAEIAAITMAACVLDCCNIYYKSCRKTI